MNVAFSATYTPPPKPSAPLSLIASLPSITPPFKISVPFTLTPPPFVARLFLICAHVLTVNVAPASMITALPCALLALLPLIVIIL